MGSFATIYMRSFHKFVSGIEKMRAGTDRYKQQDDLTSLI
jgi:hypothetical protein